MRHAEVSDEEIVAAGERLLAAGQRVTGWKLREAAGRGNPRRLLAVWLRHATTAADPSADAGAADAELPHRVAEMATELQGRAATLLDGAFRTLYRVVEETTSGRYRAEIDQLGETRARYEDEIAHAEAAVEAADEREATLVARIAELEDRLGGAAAERARLEERLLSAREHARVEIEREAAMTAQLSAKLAAAAGEAAAAREAAARQNGVAERAGEEAAQLKDELEAARSEGAATLRQTSDLRMRWTDEKKARLAFLEEAKFSARALLCALARLQPADPRFVAQFIDPAIPEGALVRWILMTRVRPDDYSAELARLGLAEGAGNPRAPADEPLAEGAPPGDNEPGQKATAFARSGFGGTYEETEIAGTVVARGHLEMLMIQEEPGASEERPEQPIPRASRPGREQHGTDGGSPKAGSETPPASARRGGAAHRPSHARRSGSKRRHPSQKA